MQTTDNIDLRYLVDTDKTFELVNHLEVILPDGRFIVIPRGFKTDLISVPMILWSFIRPIDKALIADIVHDYLWHIRVDEIKRFDGNIYKARKYADDMRFKMRKELAPRLWLKNYVTHYFLRLLGGLWYSRQLNIPKR